jgi:hypothetical protein
MAGMHALHKILANCARPQRASVIAGEFLEIEPDVFGVIVGVNGAEAKRLVADLGSRDDRGRRRNAVSQGAARCRACTRGSAALATG